MRCEINGMSIKMRIHNTNTQVIKNENRIFTLSVVILPSLFFERSGIRTVAETSVESTTYKKSGIRNAARYTSRVGPGPIYRANKWSRTTPRICERNVKREIIKAASVTEVYFFWITPTILDTIIL